MQIYGPALVHGPQSVLAPHAAKPAGAASIRSVDVSDQIDISPEAQFLTQIGEMPDIRSDRVNQLRAQIASGNYETAAKLDAALERLLDEIA
ncbi:MAG TPA: flagellar biosynthesis anti-sigma factor FlgM [Pirellulales bacterium]|jgi:negative regulator of flagellin synthesis FlgM|nr:flagellar biosynthesis anti-sigma factor FlgM [Pirellulales bacterium]